MMGWLVLAGLAVAAALLLAVIGYPRKLWTVPATAIMLGAAGYAWQGSPALPGRPASPNARQVQVDQGLIDLRDAMFGKYGTYAWSYANMADGMMRNGKPELAVAVWQGAVRQVPTDYALWTGFGLALAQQDGNTLSPAAQFAFDKALAMAPGHPGPAFFYGLALIRANRFAEAKPWWEKAVALAPENAGYRQELAARLLALDAFLQEMAERERLAPRQ